MGDTAVSLHAPVPTMFLGEGGILGNSKLKVPSPDQIFIWGDSRPTQTWSPNLSDNFHFNGGEGGEGGGYCGHHIPQIYSRNFEHKILTAQPWSCITDSLSHTTCVERVIKTQGIKVMTKLNKLSVSVIFYNLNSTLILICRHHIFAI